MPPVEKPGFEHYDMVLIGGGSGGVACGVSVIAICLSDTLTLPH